MDSSLFVVADLLKVKEVVLENFKSYEGCGASKDWQKLNCPQILRHRHVAIYMYIYIYTYTEYEYKIFFQQFFLDKYFWNDTEPVPLFTDNEILSAPNEASTRGSLQKVHLCGGFGEPRGCRVGLD